MNEQAANALYEAERKGVRQARFIHEDSTGAICANRVLIQSGNYSLVGTPWPSGECPLCGLTNTLCHGRLEFENRLVAHLNDDHRLTFSQIARKLGPDSV